MAGSEVVHDMSETLVTLLQATLPPLVDPARIYVATPDEFESLRDPASPNVTIFLYRIAVNPQMRNAPRRLRPDGTVIRELLPLELSYLITAWANDTGGELLIIGRILQALFDKGEVGAADLQGASWDSDDTVQLVLESLPLDDHYRIWDSANVPYRLSLTYMARVIGVTSTETVPVTPVLVAHVGTQS